MTENEIKNTKEWFEDFIKTYALSNQETIEFQKAVACLEEIQQYRAIGTVESLKNLPAICDSLAESGMKAEKLIEELKAYRAIGTIEEFKALKEKAEPKNAYYKKMVYPSHKWKMEDGKIDVWAYEAGYCNGPVCERCYYSFCEHCNPDGWEEECVVEDYICPSCREKVYRKNTHCKCGQKLDWSE